MNFGYSVYQICMGMSEMRMGGMTIKRMLATLLLGFCISCVTANAADTTISIKGNVKASPCTVDNSAYTATLPDFYADSSSTYSGWVDITLTLSACPSGTSNVKATFAGTEGTTPANFYANAGTAKGVNVELSSVNGTTISGMGNGKTITVSVSDKKVSIPLKARLAVVDKASLAVGTVSATVSVTFTYS